MNYNFEWNNQKAKSNLTKHGVSFQQGATVFHDQRMLVLYDKEHSTDEERWITVGLDHRGILLTVCHTYTQESEHTVRIRIFLRGRAQPKKQSNIRRCEA